MCGFHIRRFDLPFLVAELSRAGILFSLQGRAVVDVRQLLCQHEPRDLPAAVQFYLGYDFEGRHRALAAALAAAAILDAPWVRYTDLPRTVADLHAQITDMDLAGRFRRRDGPIVFAFGKHNGRALAWRSRRRRLR